MKSVPRCASSKRPTRPATAPVNAPLAWPKSSASASGSGIAAALKRDEALIRARAVVVNRPRDQLLAGAGLALNQHGAVHRRDQLQGLEDLLHRRALADDVVEAVAIAQLRAQFGVLLPQAPLVDAGRQHARQLRQLERLDEEVDGAALDRGDGFLDAAEPGHHDGEDLGVARQRGVEDVHAVGVGQPQVDDQGVVGEAFQPLERVRAVGRLGDGEAVAWSDAPAMSSRRSASSSTTSTQVGWLVIEDTKRHSREILVCADWSR